MATTPKQELHELVDRLDDEQARRLAETLRGAGRVDVAPPPRPLAEADIVPAAPVLPDDETAEEMITTVRRWRHDGGYA
jgi:hypothetical protein